MMAQWPLHPQRKHQQKPHLCLLYKKKIIGFESEVRHDGSVTTTPTEKTPARTTSLSALQENHRIRVRGATWWLSDHHTPQRKHQQKPHLCLLYKKIIESESEVRHDGSVTTTPTEKTPAKATSLSALQEEIIGSKSEVRHDGSVTTTPTEKTPAKATSLSALQENHRIRVRGVTWWLSDHHTPQRKHQQKPHLCLLYKKIIGSESEVRHDGSVTTTPTEKTPAKATSLSALQEEIIGSKSEVRHDGSVTTTPTEKTPAKATSLSALQENHRIRVRGVTWWLSDHHTPQRKHQQKPHLCLLYKKIIGSESEVRHDGSVTTTPTEKTPAKATSETSLQKKHGKFWPNDQ